MKLRWWIVGALAAVASGAFVLKHFTENKEKYLGLIDNNNEKNYNRFKTDTDKPEFEDTEFLI